jgi:L-ascorbate metabolism protein UlaG (beta-lactamase superfamily)
MGFKYIWYGHGSHGLETNGHKVLVDPYFTDCPTASTTAEECEGDFMLISHGHGDHIADAIPVAKRTGAKVISNFEISNWLSTHGVEAHPQHIGGGFHHPFGYLKFTQATHGSGLPDGSYGGNPAGFMLTTKDGLKIYLACDTGLFYGMKLFRKEKVDLAVLPIGDNFTMGPDDAFRAVKMIKPKHVIPVHYDTWPLIEQDAAAWVARVNENTKTKAHLLNPGDSFEL